MFKIKSITWLCVTISNYLKESLESVNCEAVEIAPCFVLVKIKKEVKIFFSLSLRYFFKLIVVLRLTGV